MSEISQNNSIRTHFDSAAPFYSRRQNSFIWGILRSLEVRAIRGLVPSRFKGDVLDACSGTGFYSKQFISWGATSCFAVDLSQRMCEQINSDKIQFWQGDILEFNPPSKFDLIICAGGLEFIRSPEFFLEKSIQWATENGLLLLLYPPENFAGNLYKGYHRRNGINIKLFSDNYISSICQSSGWTISKVKSPHPYARVALYEKR